MSKAFIAATRGAMEQDSILHPKFEQRHVSWRNLLRGAAGTTMVGASLMIPRGAFADDDEDHRQGQVHRGGWPPACGHVRFV
jgi:hypothetical protein